MSDPGSLSGISDAHFARWPALFGETAREVCPAPAADLFADRAGRIAESLKIGIALHSGKSVVPRLTSGDGHDRA